MSNNTYTLTEHDTVAYDDDYPHALKLFRRTKPNKVIDVLTLDASFDEPWQAAVTRKAVLEAGQVDLTKWHDLGSNFEPPAF